MVIVAGLPGFLPAGREPARPRNAYRAATPPQPRVRSTEVTTRVARRLATIRSR
jgi:hypothetical protein